MTEELGWICPRCKKSNAPSVKQCSCVQTEDSDKDTRTLLTE
jgi:phage FluMu protein Com